MHSRHITRRSHLPTRRGQVPKPGRSRPLATTDRRRWAVRFPDWTVAPLTPDSLAQLWREAS